ncbi:unnamed protein product [Cunninghamella blakesleeana]
MNMFTDTIQLYSTQYFELKRQLENEVEIYQQLEQAIHNYNHLQVKMQSFNQSCQQIEKKTKQAYDKYRQNLRDARKQIDQTKDNYHQLFNLLQNEKLQYELVFHEYSLATLKKLELETKINDYQQIRYQLNEMLGKIFSVPHQQSDHESYLETKLTRYESKRKMIIDHYFGDIVKARDQFIQAKPKLDLSIEKLRFIYDEIEKDHFDLNQQNIDLQDFLGLLYKFKSSLSSEYYDSSFYESTIFKLAEKIEQSLNKMNKVNCTEKRKDDVQSWYQQLIKLQVSFDERIQTITKTINAFNHEPIRKLEEKIKIIQREIILERQRIVEYYIEGESLLHPLSFTPAYNSDSSPPDYVTCNNIPLYLTLLE